MSDQTRLDSSENVRRLHRQQFLATAGLIVIVLLGGWYLGPKITGAADNTEALRALEDTSACRSELAADDARAQGQVILIIAQSIGTPPEGRDGYLQRLADATAELERTQERRGRTTEICDFSED